MPDPHVGLGHTELLELYRVMATAREAEARLEVLQKQGHVEGSIYPSLGQEAGVGAAFALRRRSDGTGDFVAPSLRGCAALLLFGGSLTDFFRQHFGKATGPTRGRDSGVYWGDHEKGILGPIAPLGTTIEVMAGITLSFKLRGEDRVGMVYSGDGATSTGAWHEGLAFASVQRCPMVLVVENNQWAFSTPTSRNTRLDSFVDKGAGYGIGAESVDGTDVVAVHAAASRAVARARAGKGTQLLELRYFRRRGHAQHDAQDYVDPDLIAQWERKDPLVRLADLLREAGVDNTKLEGIERAAAGACLTASEQALADPEPLGPEAREGTWTDAPAPAPWTRLPDPDPRHA